MDVLVAGVGNVLRGDDGYGVRVAQRLAEGAVPAGVRVIETGIGGIHLVQELHDRVDALIIVDAIDIGARPGTLAAFQPEVCDVTALAPVRQRDELADMHYATPDRAMMLASGLGVLPARAWIVGCQVSERDVLGEELSPAVSAAVDEGVAEVRRLVSDLGLRWAG